MASLPPDRLVSGFYLNELLLRLFARHDAHPDVFDLYHATIDSLKHASDGVRPLRIFEKRLLDALGYGLALDRDALSGQPLEAGPPITTVSNRVRFVRRISQRALMYSPARCFCHSRGRT